MRLALFQPDIAGNVGTIVRMAACLGVPIDVIEPCGFPFTDRAFRRAGMDYVDQADVTSHADWNHFRATASGRLILLTTRASDAHTAIRYSAGDILVVGQESSGAPDFVHQASDAHVRIPMREGMRSLNVALAASIVLAEALRQTGGFPA